jgi:hypothetical protein
VEQLGNSIRVELIILTKELTTFTMFSWLSKNKTKEPETFASVSDGLKKLYRESFIRSKSTTSSSNFILLHWKIPILMQSQ